MQSFDALFLSLRLTTDNFPKRAIRPNKPSADNRARKLWKRNQAGEFGNASKTSTVAEKLFWFLIIRAGEQSYPLSQRCKVQQLCAIGAAIFPLLSFITSRSWKRNSESVKGEPERLDKENISWRLQELYLNKKLRTPFFKGKALCQRFKRILKLIHPKLYICLLRTKFFIYNWIYSPRMR